MSIYAPLEHTLGIPWVVQAVALATALILVTGWLVRRQLAAAGGGVLPDEGLTVRNAVEILVEMLVGLARQTIGERWRTYMPIAGTIFVFILVANLMGLIPGLGGATSSPNTTFAWAIVSFVAYNAVGIKEHGFRYIDQFLGPSLFEVHLFGRHFHVRAMAPLFLVLEPILHLARILTLGVRLLANMSADHLVVAVWLTLVPIGVPAIFMGLGLLVAFLQAFVFSLLTMIYIGMALEEAH